MEMEIFLPILQVSAIPHGLRLVVNFVLVKIRWQIPVGKPLIHSRGLEYNHEYECSFQITQLLSLLCTY
jgi:hypothetical protein